MEQSDPKILDKLKNQPPFDTEDKKEPVSDRTSEQFNKLKGHNGELKEEVDTLKQENEELKKNLLQSLKPEPEVVPTPTPPVLNMPVTPLPQPQEYQALKPAQVEDIYARLIDSEGYVDPNLLKQTLKDANDRAKEANERAVRAEQAAQEAQKQVKQTQQQIYQSQKDIEENEKMKKVHTQFPQLDPNGPSFDSRFFDAVRNELIGQMVNGKEDPLEAAQKWSDILYPVTPKEEKKVQEQKNQINALPNTGRKVDYSGNDQEALRQASIVGKKGALAERLRRSNY